MRALSSKSGTGIDAESFGLPELIDLAGQRLGERITPRTVRLYATQGLMDRPGRAGRSATYTRRQLLQLLLIRTLVRRGLSLSAIAPLCVLDDVQLEKYLMGLDADGSRQPRPTTKEPFPQVNKALGHPQSIHGEPDLPGEIRSKKSFGSLLPLLGTPLTSGGQPGRQEIFLSSSGRDSASRWHRFTLAPGVELHISESVAIPPAGDRRLSWLHRLGDRLVELLDQPRA